MGYVHGGPPQRVVGDSGSECRRHVLRNRSSTSINLWWRESVAAGSRPALAGSRGVPIPYRDRRRRIPVHHRAARPLWVVGAATAALNITDGDDTLADSHRGHPYLTQRADLSKVTR